jgi:hypothetical protein
VHIQWQKTEPSKAEPHRPTDLIETVSRITQGATLTVAMLYIAGIVIVSLSLSAFGSIGFDLLKVRYVIVGILGSIFLFLNIISVSFSFYLSVTERYKSYFDVLARLVIFLICIVFGSIIFSSVFLLLERSYFTNVKLPTQTNSFSLLINLWYMYFSKAEWIFILVFGALLYLYKLRKKTTILSEIARLFTCLIAVTVFLTSSSHLFSFLGSEFDFSQAESTSTVIMFVILHGSLTIYSFYFFSVEYLGTDFSSKIESLEQSIAFKRTAQMTVALGVFVALLGTYPMCQEYTHSFLSILVEVNQ